jgi:cbb3-type cytochrome oxidase maturation protein
MDVFLPLTIAAIILGAIGLAVFFWTLRSGQYDDLDGAAERILMPDENDEPPPS